MKALAQGRLYRCMDPAAIVSCNRERKSATCEGLIFTIYHRRPKVRP